MRKHKVVTIAAEGRDKGKSFLIVEKSAYEAEKWATRALLALSQAGAQVGDDALASGALGILVAGLEAFKVLPYDLAEPLLDEMMTCVSFVPDPAKINPDTLRPLSRGLRTDDDEGDIQEVATLLKLRSEVLDLHLGFSVTAALSSLAAAAGNHSSQQTTSMSPEPVGSPSAVGAPA
jgi:hypothetical protein